MTGILSPDGGRLVRAIVGEPWTHRAGAGWLLLPLHRGILNSAVGRNPRSPGRSLVESTIVGIRTLGARAGRLLLLTGTPLRPRRSRLVKTIVRLKILVPSAPGREEDPARRICDC